MLRRDGELLLGLLRGRIRTIESLLGMCPILLGPGPRSASSRSVWTRSTRPAVWVKLWSATSSWAWVSWRTMMAWSAADVACSTSYSARVRCSSLRRSAVGDSTRAWMSRRCCRYSSRNCSPDNVAVASRRCASATARRSSVARLGRGFVNAIRSMNATVSAGVRRVPASTRACGSSAQIPPRR